MGYCSIQDVRDEIITDKTDEQIQAIIDEKTEFIEKIINFAYAPEELPKPVSRACVILVCQEIEPDYEAVIADGNVGAFSIKKETQKLTDDDAITSIPYVNMVLKLYKKLSVTLLDLSEEIED